MVAPGALERALRLLERVERRSSRLLTVFTYHRVDTFAARPELDPALISTTPEEFEHQAAWLAGNASPLSLADLLEVKRGAAQLPRRAVLVTFDDAYRDFAWHAWPALRRVGVPVTLFVPTAYPGEPSRRFWWDRLHSALGSTLRIEPIDTPAGRLPLDTMEDRRRAHRTLAAWVASAPHDEAMTTVELLCAMLGEPEVDPPVLDWSELRALAGDGVALAPHSRTHPRLDQLPLERAREEIAGSRDDLTREIGRGCPPAFAFPGGGHRDGLVRVLAEEGFELGFTTLRGPNDLARLDWLSLRRSNVGRRTTLPILRAQLLSWSGAAVKAVAVAGGR